MILAKFQMIIVKLKSAIESKLPGKKIIPDFSNIRNFIN